MSEKLCWFCQHFYWNNAERDWSDVTPGHDFEMYCNKRHWEFDVYKTSQLEFSDMINKAKTCKDFVLLESLKNQEKV
jgi:hypothetical protein